MSKSRNILISSVIGIGSLALAYVPLPGVSQSIVVVSGSELQEPLAVLEAEFEQQYPDIDLQLEFQGSQDIVNNYIDDKNRFVPTVLIPANGEVFNDLESRWQSDRKSVV